MASSSYSNSNQKALTKMNLKARRITVIYIPLRTSGIFWKSFGKEREWHLLYLVESMILKKNNPKGFQDFLGHKSTTSTAPNRVSSTWPHAPHPQPSKDDGVAFARPARASATEESGDAKNVFSSCRRDVNMLRWRMNPLPNIYINEKHPGLVYLIPKIPPFHIWYLFGIVVMVWCEKTVGKDLEDLIGWSSQLKQTPFPPMRHEDIQGSLYMTNQPKQSTIRRKKTIKL